MVEEEVEGEVSSGFSVLAPRGESGAVMEVSDLDVHASFLWRTNFRPRDFGSPELNFVMLRNHCRPLSRTSVS
ncbi:UNVERIFIED_CONTAM: hypothetical protein NY603_29315, partial [Bacteroidetes bacterium 56_B9]